MREKVAFFDIDGTVFRSSLLIELVEMLIDADIFPKNITDGYEDEYRAWRDREGTYEAYIKAVIAVFNEHLQGIPFGAMSDMGRQIVAANSKRVYRYTRDLIQDLKQQDYYIVAISHSPKAVLDEFCRAYGFDKVYGRMYEVGPTDRFTGTVIDEHLIQNKATIVRRVFDELGGVPAHSIAVGDTESDIPMLEAVQEAVCFNPNQKLYSHAMRVGWKVVVERKDVIYEIG